MTEARGVLAIQIDGLPHRYLRGALARGELPHLGRLIQEGYRLQRYRSALPCNTPAGQSAIFYGFNDNIPAFRWWERSTSRLIDFSSPEGVQHIESRLSEGRAGLLRKGSSYVNLVTGGSRRAVLTTGAFSWNRWQEKLGNFDVTLSLLSRPSLVKNVLKHSNFQLWLEFLQALWASVSQGRWVVSHQFRVIDFVSSILIPALQTAGAALDMKRGLPIIYSNYIAFDEAGHYTGLHTAETLRALRRIDQMIGHLDDLRRKTERPYDLVVLSDHGMTPSIPFKLQFGLDFAHWVQLMAPDAVVLDSSPLSHVYLEPGERLSLSAIERRYPHVLGQFLRHPGLGLIVAREGDEVVFLSDDDHHPFARLEDPEAWRADAERLARMPDSGDLMVFGRFTSHGTVVNFERQWAGHGSLGGDQGYPFLLTPPHWNWHVQEPPDLYHHFQAHFPHLFT